MQRKKQGEEDGSKRYSADLLKISLFVLVVVTRIGRKNSTLDLYVGLISQERDGYWKMMQKYIGSDVTSMVTLPVIIFEPMTMLQKMAEVCAHDHI